MTSLTLGAILAMFAMMIGIGLFVIDESHKEKKSIESRIERLERITNSYEAMEKN